jgi:hypothetical protein
MKNLSKNQEAENKNLSLKISAKNENPLTKNQEIFNKLTQKIEKLEKGNVEHFKKLDNLLIYFNANVKPLITEIANVQLRLALILSEQSGKFNFSKNQTEEINKVILKLCNEAFENIEPTDEQEAFYNSRSKTTYKEEIEEQEKNSKEIFVDMLNTMFGDKFDAGDIEDSEDGFMNFQKKMNEEFENLEKNNSKNKKTKKQIQLEKQKEQEEAVKTKSIRSIYITLAKILHPDTETDPILKLEKEEIMKKVTGAYESKDLPALLKLEMEFVHKQCEFLDQLTDEKLKIYISALREQARELEQEKQSLAYQPKYSEIKNLAFLSEKAATLQLSKDARIFDILKQTYTSQIRAFENRSSKKEIISFVKEYSDDYDDHYDDEVSQMDDFIKLMLKSTKKPGF